MTDDDDHKQPVRRRPPRAQPADDDGKGAREPPTVLTMWRAGVAAVHAAASRQRAVDAPPAGPARRGPSN
ncbi:MAG: hypothetical protein IPH44_34155 [Myxococcales bacterium]|nr:hypothetical protein [Myxococcales bacterium]MBK7192634.1 hypothetical protein [Myxococcales bacterium]MBP6847523.1 hypothetical protein [Kofleriaceae bacterium]